jgi:hypothetical protein
MEGALQIMLIQFKVSFPTNFRIGIQTSRSFIIYRWMEQYRYELRL